MSYDLFGTKIEDTYQRLLQVTSGDTVVDGRGNASIFDYGTYTPIIYEIANLTGSTNSLCQYLKVGNVVTVSGEVVITPIDVAVLTKLDISLPIASTFTLINNCAGTAISSDAGRGASIHADSGNTKAEMEWLSDDTDQHAMFFQFTYQII